MHINGIVTVGLQDKGADVSIITPEFWHPDWLLQEEPYSQVKQSTKWVDCIEPERQKE